MVTVISKISSGLLHQFDGTLIGWTVAAGWSQGNLPAYSCFNPLPLPIVGGDGVFDDYLGCREAHAFRENGIDYVIYDACGLDRIGWVDYIAYSTDGWLTKQRFGPLNFGLSIPGGGSYTGAFTEYFMKVGDTYYIMVAATSGPKLAFGPGNYPLAAGGNFPYVVWTSKSILGPYVGTIVPNPGVSWGVTNFATNSILLVGGVFYNYGAGDVPFVEGLSTSLSLLGPWVISGPADQILPVVLPFFGGAPRGQEGFSPFLSPTHGIYVSIINSYQSAAIGYDDANVLVYGSADQTVWPNVRGTRIQSATPMEGSTIAVNEGVPIHGPDGALIYDPATGIVPFTFSTCSVPTIGFGLSPQIRYITKIAMLEPSSNAMVVAGNGILTPILATYPLVHTDLSLEFTFESSADDGIPSLTVEFRSDAPRQNLYSINITPGTAVLSKIVGGVPTVLQTNSGLTQQITSGISRPYRAQLVCIGNRVQFFLDGESQIDYGTLSPIASGVQIGLAPKGYNAEVRCMSARKSNTVTFSGMIPGTYAVVKAPCDYATGAYMADPSGVATFTHPHFPMSKVTVDGVDLAPAGGVWGGDSYDISGQPVVNSSLQAVIGL